MIAARLLGIREFSLAALVERYFGEADQRLAKGELGAAPAPAADGGVRDERHALSARRWPGRWKRNCARTGASNGSSNRANAVLAQAAVERVRDEEEAWRISGSGTLSPRASAVLRALWRWRDQEAQAADRPSFFSHSAKSSARAGGKGFRCRPEPSSGISTRVAGAVSGCGGGGAATSRIGMAAATAAPRGLRPTQKMERAARVCGGVVSRGGATRSGSFVHRAARDGRLDRGRRGAKLGVCSCRGSCGAIYLQL